MALGDRAHDIKYHLLFFLPFDTSTLRLLPVLAGIPEHRMKRRVAGYKQSLEADLAYSLFVVFVW
jgi:hypothetical protein